MWREAPVLKEWSQRQWYKNKELKKIREAAMWLSGEKRALRWEHS